MDAPGRAHRHAHRAGGDCDGGEVFGETANVAARVQGAAEPDTVVITAATQRLVAGCSWSRTAGRRC
jgi:class 3 adenylate cyclase